jgi:hypothetical protein
VFRSWRVPGRMFVLDGGRDAPMGPKDQRLFKIIFGIAAVVAGALLLLLIVG